MAYPTGSGTEILKSHRIIGLNSSAWTDLIPVADTDVNKTVIVISIVAMNSDSSTKDLNIATHMYNGSSYSAESRFIYMQSMPAKSTFVFNERMVLYSGSSSTRQSLRALMESGGDTDIHTSYILQDWT